MLYDRLGRARFLKVYTAVVGRPGMVNEHIGAGSARFLQFQQRPRTRHPDADVARARHPHPLRQTGTASGNDIERQRTVFGGVAHVLGDGVHAGVVDRFGSVIEHGEDESGAVGIKRRGIVAEEAECRGERSASGRIELRGKYGEARTEHVKRRGGARRPDTQPIVRIVPEEVRVVLGKLA